ncbi:10834_t:CDS:1, partial [Dentiscutata heterogama]
VSKDQGRTIKVPIFNTSNDNLKPPRSKFVDMRSNSDDTFAKFIYKDKVLNEIKEYNTKELATEEVGLYNNPWVETESSAIYLTTIEKTLTQNKKPPEQTINKLLKEFV